MSCIPSRYYLGVYEAFFLLATSLVAYEEGIEHWPYTFKLLLLSH